MGKRLTANVLLTVVLAACSAGSSPEAHPFVGGKGDSFEQSACDQCIGDWLACDEAAAGSGVDSARCWMGFNACVEYEALVGLCSAATELSRACTTCGSDYTACADDASTGPDDARCWMNYVGCVRHEGEVGLCAYEPEGPTMVIDEEVTCDDCAFAYDECVEGEGRDETKCRGEFGECLRGEMLVGSCDVGETVFASRACLACGASYEECTDDAQDGADLGACYFAMDSCIGDAGEVGVCNISYPPTPCHACLSAHAECTNNAQDGSDLNACDEVVAECIGTTAHPVYLCTVEDWSPADHSAPCRDCNDRFDECSGDAVYSDEYELCQELFSDCIVFIEEGGFCAGDDVGGF